ncbi:restriction endonuclease subunit S [Acinetobacter pittii]|uniref:Restriction endonuclease subunit S n=2 Tax=Acinetobacter TaxID=469 RepID=A0AA46S780_9GAMM|nr:MULTISPECIES: restriction endonuclease subunit S [Acinetobacter]MDI9742995.1 restriction endonuclease subunit S [Acinetobacter nosocomialis]MDX8266393.1 restriction endonuclease subunit S [Acinetobacter pittii]UYF76034.1 restriction endonuclease subunit S [Acinetobacter ursingii]
MSFCQKMKLNEAGITLIDCDHKTPAAQASGYPYVGIPQLKDGHIRLDGARLISEEDFVLWTKKAKPQLNDVILSRRCNPGESAYVPESLEIALGQNLVLLRSDGSVIYPPFLRWLVQGNEWWEQVNKFLNVGAVFNSLKCKDIPNFKLTIPSLKEQREITDILSSLDKKIELNSKLNQTLESIAQAIFKSWFIDFEPVRAKIAAKQEGKDPERAAMCAISGKSETELKQMAEDDFAELQATAALFPDELVESELGEVPKGWKVKPLDEIANYLNGLALQKFRPENEHEFLPIVKIAQLKSGIATIEEKASPNIDPKFIINNGDVIFSWSGSLMVDIWCGGKAALNQHLFKVTSIDYPKWFYCSYTKHHLAEFQRIAQAKAVTMGHIKREHLSQALCIVPSNQVLDIGNNVIGAQMQKQIVLRLENNNLIQVRDTLLPKLLSGELDVSRLASETEYEYSTE